MAVFVLFFSALLTKVPMAALAALLVQVGVKLVKIKEIKKVAAFGDLLVYLVTIGGVVFWNLLWGIATPMGGSSGSASLCWWPWRRTLWASASGYSSACW